VTGYTSGHDALEKRHPDGRDHPICEPGARIAALRLLSLLPPHIAEESDQKMDEMEAVMAKEDQEVRKNLEDLAGLRSLSGNPDLSTATGRYARFTELKAQILKLSRRCLGLGVAGN
jgi:hypothetical protein